MRRGEGSKTEGESGCFLADVIGCSNVHVHVEFIAVEFHISFYDVWFIVYIVIVVRCSGSHGFQEREIVREGIDGSYSV